MDDLDAVAVAETAWKDARREAAAAYAERNHAVRRAHERGFKPGAIAEVLGCTVGRVSQILGPKQERARKRVP